MSDSYNPSIDPHDGYIVCQDSYKVCKGPNKTYVYTKELREVIFDILKEIDRVCRKNNIDYALAFGTALGIYNYQDFIPWDDDADIIIKYEDINRLIEAFKKDLGPDYYFDCNETNERYNAFFPTFKVRKRNTYCEEKNYLIMPNRCKQGNGVFVDICAFMGVPPHKEQMKIIRKMKRKIILSCILDMLHITPIKMWKKVKELEKRVYEKYKDSILVGQTVIIPYQNHRKEITELAYPLDMIYPFKEYTFHGYKFYSVNNLKGFISAFYSSNCLRKFVNGKWIDPRRDNKKKPDHYHYINLFSDTKK